MSKFRNLNWRNSNRTCDLGANITLTLESSVLVKGSFFNYIENTWKAGYKHWKNLIFSQYRVILFVLIVSGSMGEGVLCGPNSFLQPFITCGSIFGRWTLSFLQPFITCGSIFGRWTLSFLHVYQPRKASHKIPFDQHSPRTSILYFSFNEFDVFWHLYISLIISSAGYLKWNKILAPRTTYYLS